MDRRLTNKHRLAADSLSNLALTIAEITRKQSEAVAEQAENIFERLTKQQAEWERLKNNLEADLDDLDRQALSVVKPIKSDGK